MKNTFYTLIFVLLPLLLLAQNTTFKPGDRVMVLSEKDGKQYPAVVKSVENGLFHISYDGYASSYDETVPPARLQPFNPGGSSTLPYIDAEKGQTFSVQGDITGGALLPLAWAAQSNMACFPATRFVEFEGKHVFFRTQVPVRSEITITVTPLDGQRINLYAYSGFDGEALPPEVASCVSCEAGYEMWAGHQPPKDFTRSAGPQRVRLRAIDRPFDVLIGVAGAKGVTEGRFELKTSTE